jgi:hypothetical protein
MFLLFHKTEYMQHRFTFPIVLLFLCFTSLNAQHKDSLNQDASPKYGINHLAIKYLGIDFTKDQRNELKDKEIEFIFSLDEYGNPTLAEVNGVTNPHIIDSLISKTKDVERFNPRIRNGTAEPSIYFMHLTFPSYKFSNQVYGILQGSAYNEAKLEDFEYINETGQRLDMIIGGFANQFLGKPSRHLTIGGGMKMDINFTAKNKLFYGMNMSFAQNGLKEDYPINSLRKQTAPVSGFVGLSFGKWFSNYTVQFDLDVTVHNIIKRNGENDPDWFQLNGWSPGIVVFYPVWQGKVKPMYSYGSPTLVNQNLNLNLGLRYVSYSLKEASGIMVEFGASYRLGFKIINKFKLKDEFLNR